MSDTLHNTHQDSETEDESRSGDTLPSGYPNTEVVVWPSAGTRGGLRPTHRLVTVSPDRLEFRQTWVVILGGVLFLLFGFVGIGSAVYKHSEGTHWIGVAVLALLGGIFTLVGSGLLAGYTALLVFDKRRDLCWFGRHIPEEDPKGYTPPYRVKISDIKAIELDSRYYPPLSSEDKGYTAYETVLLLNSGERIKVLNYEGRQSVRDNAQTLAAFIDKPLSDHT